MDCWKGKGCERPLWKESSSNLRGELDVNVNSISTKQVPVQSARETHSIPRHLWTAALGSDIILLSGEPDYFGRNEISSGGDLSHYSSASLY